MEQRSHSHGLAGLDLGDVPSAGLDYLRAQHQLLYRQTLYDLLIKQYDAARLDEAKEAAIIQVLEPATEPDRKSAPRRVWIAFCAMLLGFFASAFYILAAMAFARARRSPEIDLQFSALKAALTIERHSTR